MHSKPAGSVDSLRYSRIRAGAGLTAPQAHLEV